MIDLFAYLYYMSAWKNASDADIKEIINEFNLFLQLGDFASDSIVEEEFEKVENLATELRDYAVDTDKIQIAADVVAVTMIWSFGWGLAAFAILEADVIVRQGEISKKSDKLNNKLATLDSDIASQISPNVSDYITQFKKNNTLMMSKAPDGFDSSKIREILFQFMAELRRIHECLDVPTFRKYVDSVHNIFYGSEIKKLYKALDDLNMSKKSPDDVDIKNLINTITGLDLPIEIETAVHLVQAVTIGIIKNKLKIKEEKIKKAIEEVTETRRAEEIAALKDLVDKNEAVQLAEAEFAKAQTKAVGEDITIEDLNAKRKAVDDARKAKKTANETVQEKQSKVRNAETVVEKASKGSFKAMNGIEGFTVVMMIAISVIDIILQCLDIKKLNEQTATLCSALKEKIKPKYKAYFNGMREASKAYREAIEPNTP